MEGEITRQLRAVRGGGREEFDRLFELVYAQLKRMAARELRGRQGMPTLDATALVHEAYLKLVDQTHAEWTDRQHFFAVAAQVLRHLIVDHIRRRQTARRGGGVVGALEGEESAVRAPPVEEILAVDAALHRLAAIDPRLVQVVELRFFVGFSLEEIAELTDVSLRTAKRRWQTARTLLLDLIRPAG